MEESRCPVPGCGKKIGGTNHVAVKGATRLDRDAMATDAAKPGYFASATTGENAEVTNRAISKLALRVLRLFLHGALQIALQSGTPAAQAAANLVRGAGSSTSTQAIVDVSSACVAQRMKEDWSALRQHTGLGAAALTLALHLVLKRSSSTSGCQSALWSYPSSLETFAGRNALEYTVQWDVVEAVLAPSGQHIRSTGSCLEQLEEARTELAATGATRAVRSALGETHWVALYEQDEHQLTLDGVDGDAAAALLLDKCVWRYRTPVSFEHFQRFFAMRGAHAAAHPLLGCFLKHEARLPLIKHLADVLEWHSILFGIFGSGGGRTPLERARAAELSNNDVIVMLPVPQRPLAQGVLDRYCVAFNACFIEVLFLYECQANPFIRSAATGNADSKVVDLTGTKTGGDEAQMCGHTPVAFSLPSQVQGETDAQGLCTIRLLELLQTTHNDLLISLLKSKQKGAEPIEDEEVLEVYRRDIPRRWAVAPGVEHAPEPVEEANNGEAEVEEAAPLHEVPAVSYLTDRRVVQRQIIGYDRRSDLLPLLSASSVQSIAAGQGSALEYDMPRLEEALSAQLLGRGVVPLALSIRHFHYQGEVHAVGLLGALGASVPQAALPVSVLDQVWSEISTAHRLARLLAMLETVVRFVGSVGSSLAAAAISPTMRLETFTLEVLLILPEQTAEVLTATICSGVQLAHLASLYKGMDQRANGDPVERIAQSYRELLPDVLKVALETGVDGTFGAFDVGLVLGALRDLITEQLTEAVFPPDAGLAMYIGFASAVELEDEVWWEAGFPEELQLCHAMAVYRWLADRHAAMA